MDKLCKDCKHYLPVLCTRPGSYKLNLVTGTLEYNMDYLARYQRWTWIGYDILTSTCGKRGRFWKKNLEKGIK